MNLHCKLTLVVGKLPITALEECCPHIHRGKLNGLGDAGHDDVEFELFDARDDGNGCSISTMSRGKGNNR